MGVEDAEEADPEPPAPADPPPSPPDPDPGIGAEGRFSLAEPPSWLPECGSAVIAAWDASMEAKMVDTGERAEMPDQPQA